MKIIDRADYTFQLDDDRKTYRIILLCGDKILYLSSYLYKQICKEMEIHEEKGYSPIELINAIDKTEKG